MYNKLIDFISSGFGVGYFPYFPGTLASFLILVPLWFIKGGLETQTFILLIIISAFISMYIISKTIKHLKNKDPKFIVIDEYIGQASAIFFCNQSITDYLVAFLGFRVLDIYKPFPINIFDKIKNSFGVLFDDLLAGCFISLLFWIHYHG